MKHYKTVFISLFGIILFKYLLDKSYQDFVSPLYAYAGFSLDFNMVKYIEGWIVYLFLYYILYLKREHVVYMVLLLIFLLLISPTITMYAYKNEPSEAFYAIVIPYSLFLFFINTKKTIKMRTIKQGRSIVIYGTTFLTLLVLVHYMGTVGIGNINFDLEKVYDLREKFDSVSTSGIFGYLNPWVSEVFNIFLISWTLYKKKYKLLILFVLFQVLIFGYSGHKSSLFLLIIIIGLYYFDKVRNQTAIIIYSFISLISLLLVYYQLTNELILPSTFIRRAFFVPANLNYVYIDFFSNNEYVFWSNSILKSFIDYPYDIRTVQVVGRYLGKADMAANTGLLGTGFMHLGIFGILLYIMIITIFVNLLNSFNKFPKWLINSIIAMPLLSAFTSSDLMTSFLTGGLLLAFIIMYLINSKKDIKYQFNKIKN